MSQPETPIPGEGENAPPDLSVEQSTLRDLAERALVGDHEAFEGLHHRVGAGVRRMLMKRAGAREDLVDDVCQQTWTSVWKALQERKYDPARAAFSTFVYAVANNAWLTHLRGFARDRGYSGGGPAMLGERHLEEGASRRAEAADDARAQAETIECVRACLREDGPGGLTDDERAVVRAIGAGESDRGLARRLGISSSTVNLRKHAGYAKIREYLRSRGIVEAEEPGLDESGAPSDSHPAVGGPAQSSGRTGGTVGGTIGGTGLGRDAALADHAGRMP